MTIQCVVDVVVVIVSFDEMNRNKKKRHENATIIVIA